MPFLDVVDSCFDSRDLYAVLGVQKDAGEGDIRRAYHKISLKVHPDRVESGDVEEATKKFQTLGKIYSVLMDKDKRAIYDEDGSVDEEDDTIFKQDRDWREYWRLLFPKVTVDDIRNFEESYRGSEEEREAVKAVYLDKEGDMDAMLENVMCASVEDEPRFREMIQGWIETDEVPTFPAFVKESKAKKRARANKWKKEAQEAAQAMQENGNEGSSSLTALIRARQKSREQEVGNFFDALEEKYSKNAKKPKLTKNSDDVAGGKSRRRKGAGKR